MIVLSINQYSLRRISKEKRAAAKQNLFRSLLFNENKNPAPLKHKKKERRRKKKISDFYSHRREESSQAIRSCKLNFFPIIKN
jgi:hypothetical protein